jgi:hypothetical protein
MSHVVIAFLLVVGLGQCLFARQIADQRASTHFGTRVQPTDVQTTRRVKHFRAMTIALNVIIGGAIALSCAVYLLR